MAYSKLKRMAAYDQDGSNPLAETQLNWQGVNYVDDPSAMLPIQVPYAKNVDFGDPIGGATKRGGLENLFASLGSGGTKGLHTWKHSSGDVLFAAWGTALYHLAGGSGTATKTSQADWAAGTLSQVNHLLTSGSLKLDKTNITADVDFRNGANKVVLTSTNPIGQTFTTDTGVTNLARVQCVFSNTTAGETITLSIWNSTSKSTLIGSTTYTTTAEATQNPNIDFTPVIPLTQTTQYYLELTHAGDGGNAVSVWYYYDGSADGYAGGQLYVNGVAQTLADMRFSTYYGADNYTSGTWTSPSIDLSSTPISATLSWTVTTPAGTSLTWQTRSSENNSTWGDYRTINASGDGIPLGRYVQIKISFTGTTSATPTVSDCTIDYSTDYTAATSIKTGLSGNRVRFADFLPDDHCYVCDGGQPFIVYKDDAGDIQVRDAGVDAPSTAPTLADGGAGSLTGVYYGKITFVNDDGVEGNPSGASGSLNITSKQITWTISTGPTGTAKRKLYRTKAGGSTYYLVTTVEDNSTTSYTDTTADSSLVTEMNEDNHVPPTADIVFEFQNYMFYVSHDDPSQLWYSKVGEPEQVPNSTSSMFYKAFPGPITAIEATNNALVIHGDDFVQPIVASGSGFVFHSNPATDTTIIRYIDKSGALSQESITMCVDPELRQIMVFPTNSGVRFLLPGLQEESLESVPLSRNIQPYFDESVSRSNMAAVFYNNRYFLAFTWQETGAATATENNVIFVYDFRSKQWSGPWTIGANSFAIAGNNLYCGDSANGKVYKMFSGNSDAGSAIEMILDLPVISPAGIQGTCRFTRLVVEVSADSTTTSTSIKPKVDNGEATISLGTLSSSFTGDTRPGHNTIRSRKYTIPLAQGHTLSHRIVDNSTNALSVRKIITEYEVIPIRT